MNKSLKPGSRKASSQSKKGLKSSSNSLLKEKATRAFIASAKQSRTMPARVNSTLKGSHVNHRELIGTVNGSVAFTATKYVCNPGIAATFPWLSVQAGQWEQYRFNKLRFRYLTRTATTTVGSILMAPDYDPTDSPPSTELAVSTYQDCVEDAVWVEELCCDLNVASMFPNGQRKFVRSSGVGLEDLKLYDAANFFLCTVEEANANAIGKLWVEYDVDFFTPQTHSGSSTNDARFASHYVDSDAESLASGISKALTLSDIVCDPLSIGTPAAGIFTPAAGMYRFEAQCSVNDTLGSGNLLLNLELWKNGAVLAAGSRSLSTVGQYHASANHKLFVSCDAVAAMSGSDTFQIQLTATTDSGGVLTVVADSQSLTVTPV